jgi:hypothetical protein
MREKAERIALQRSSRRKGSKQRSQQPGESAEDADPHVPSAEDQLQVKLSAATIRPFQV